MIDDDEDDDDDDDGTLAPVVQSVDNAIHRVNGYLVDKY